MARKKTFVAGKRIYHRKEEISGELIQVGEERFFRINHVNTMPPFLMSIVSNSDHWMYISSNGGLSAGRKNPDRAIFPYYTDDKIHDSAVTTGGKAIIRLKNKNKWYIWEPYSPYFEGIYNFTRNLYKSIHGNKIIFEEINHDLELRFREIWMNSDKYGWIRESRILNLSESKQHFQILDGVQNLLPAGIVKEVHERFSTLMDAYKRAELESPSNLGIISLSSIPVDRAEPSEALRATTVWSTLENPEAILLSETQLDAFRMGSKIETEDEARGVRPAYFNIASVSLDPLEAHYQLMALDVYKDSAEIQNLLKYLNKSIARERKIRKDILEGDKKLEKIVFRADGKQSGGDEKMAIRHFSNVLFNLMRGGIFENDYQVNKKDFVNHLSKFNREILSEATQWLENLPQVLEHADLYKRAVKSNIKELPRLVLEFLPLTFSRRHGDPSRPWNRFSIDIKNTDGSRSLSYQGNWRDIFQNWEALAYSFPAYLEAFITKFLNASTIDGYNPYRITDQGVDWEVFDPEDPWSFIGYWGDHQVIYLLKLLELYNSFYPGLLAQKLGQTDYVFADVPYRIKALNEILQDPHNTIFFHQERHDQLLKQSKELGADGKLLRDNKNQLRKASLAEKLLIPLMTKVSNLIPGAGIWLNTQRPEWNDANNALVGKGASMVTVYYMRRYVQYFESILRDQNAASLPLSVDAQLFLSSLTKELKNQKSLLTKNLGDKERLSIIKILGKTGEDYRTRVYAPGENSYLDVPVQELLDFLSLVKTYLDHSIELNQRDDHLFHAYNLVEIKGKEIQVNNLPLMLEGQVAYLSSGHAQTEEIIKILRALYESPLYRKDQHSFMLYPDRALPRFTYKNNIPKNVAAGIKTTAKLINSGNRDILMEDELGNLHFNGDLKNEGVLSERMNTLVKKGVLDLSPEEQQDIKYLYEAEFTHKSFTGRSGSFFKYEGLGSIYWHMVSKLLLAIAENLRNLPENLDEESKAELFEFYYEIKAGLGLHKNPRDYGAFPIDPYSHTPSMMGVQQPGMTGQVKEDIISRWYELGIKIDAGCLSLLPDKVDGREFDAKGELSFTFCGIPVQYRKSDRSGMKITYMDGNEQKLESQDLGFGDSQTLFNRSGIIKKITAYYAI